MNKFMLKMMGLESLKPIEGTLIMEVNGVKHDVTFSSGNTLKIVGPSAKKLGDALGMVGVKLTLKEKSNGSRTYTVKEG